MIATPRFLRAAMAGAVLAFGGSRKAAKPAITSCVVSRSARKPSSNASRLPRKTGVIVKNGTNTFLPSVNIGKQLETFHALDTGVFRITPALMDELARVNGPDGCSLSQGVAALAARGQMRVVDVGDAMWIDVDTPALPSAGASAGAAAGSAADAAAGSAAEATGVVMRIARAVAVGDRYLCMFGLDAMG